jgi:hypothetical protein
MVLCLSQHWNLYAYTSVQISTTLQFSGPVCILSQLEEMSTLLTMDSNGTFRRYIKCILNRTITNQMAGR